MPLLLLASCAYTLVDYTVPSLPDTYMTEPQARDLYCEVGYSYAEGFTIEEAKLRLYKVCPNPHDNYKTYNPATE